jgi:hypothetical protein
MYKNGHVVVVAVKVSEDHKIEGEFFLSFGIYVHFLFVDKNTACYRLLNINTESH